MYLSIEVSTYQRNTWNPKPETRNLRRDSAERVGEKPGTWNLELERSE